MKNFKLFGFIILMTVLSINVSSVFALGEDLTPPATPPADLCPNIDGAQVSIPTGMILDGSGNCITPIPADTTPPVISNIQATALSFNEVSITWTTNELATSRVTYDEAHHGHSTELFLNASALTTHVAAIAGLSADTTYHFCVYATDLAGNSTNSCGHSVKTAVAPVVADTIPPVISGIANVSILYNTATITWLTNELSLSNLTYGLTTNYGSQAPVNATLLLAHTSLITGLSPSTTYYYCIHAVDISDNAANSCGHSFTTAAAPVTPDTTAPTISNLSSLSLTPSNATIVWNTNELSVATLQYGTTTNYGSQATISTSALLAHEATLSGLSPSTTYYYCIHSVDLSGNQASSCNHSFTTAQTLTVVDTTPPDIASINVAPVTTTSATVNFITSEVSNAQIEYGTTASYGTITALDTNLALTHTVTLSNLIPNTLYHYRIRTGDELGNETISPDETFTTAALSLIESQQVMTNVNISGIESASVSTTSATINWNTNIPSDSQVEYGNSQDFGSVTTLDTTLGTNHSVVIDNLTPNTNYIFRVKSKVAGAPMTTVSENHEFNTLSVATPVVAPANILSVSSGTLTSTGATITWTTDKATTSQVEYGVSTSYGETSILDSTMTTSHSTALADLTSNTTYHYRVRSVDEALNITYSEDYTFTTAAVINSSNQNSNIQTSPVAITNLTASDYDQSSVNLVWYVGSAHVDAAQQYDIRYGTNPITAQNWASATPAQTTPIYYVDLSPSGTERSYIVAGLNTNTTYYFALASKFANTSYSDLSNVVSATTTGGGSVNNGDSSANSNAYGNAYGNASGGAALSSSQPTLVKAKGADSEIIFSWKNPGESNFVRTVVIRGEGAYPSSPVDGTTLYEGHSETFTDTNIQNGTTYYYAIYSYNHNKTYSSPVKVSTSPNPANKEVKFNESGFISTISPVEHFTRVFKKGDQDIEIEHLQEILTEHGYPQKIIDGKFGPLTERALKSFQSQNNLLPTGILDAATQKELNAITEFEIKLDVPAEYSIFLSDIKRGDQGEKVFALQTYLAYEGSLSINDVDGLYGVKTKSAVMSFQKKYNIKADGLVGPQTRHKMMKLAGL